MDIFIEYLKVFITGGIICSIGQILIDKTKLTPARILVIFVNIRNNTYFNWNLWKNS